jgi:hypothetical protein
VSKGDLGAQLQVIPLQAGSSPVSGVLPPAIVSLDCRPGSSTFMAGGSAQSHACSL